MDKLILIFIATLTGVIACNKGHHVHHGWGWGWGEPVLYVPKPTLFPKLKAAYLDGKLSVNYHKIVAPSLKPLPYKKGVGWLGKGWGWGWGPGYHHVNAIGYGPAHFHGKTGYLGIKGEVGLHGPIVPNVGLGPIPVTPIIPLAPKLPIPHHHEHHHVSEHAVTVVEKGLPGHHHPIPLGPVGPIGHHHHHGHGIGHGLPHKK